MHRGRRFIPEGLRRLGNLSVQELQIARKKRRSPAPPCHLETVAVINSIGANGFDAAAENYARALEDCQLKHLREAKKGSRGALFSLSKLVKRTK